MYLLKAFININTFANNDPMITAPLGELSNSSATYAIDKGYYELPAFPHVEMVSFTSRRDGGANIKVPSQVSDVVLEVAQWVFSNSIAAKFANDAAGFRTQLLSKFGPKMSGCITGDMITHRGNWMPTFIEFSLVGFETNKLRFWFANEAFAGQYDDYQIIVNAPHLPVDDYHKVASVVKPIIAGFDVPTHNKKLLALTGNEPYTLLRSENFAWFDKEDQTVTANTVWSVAIYGAAGNSLTIMKDAIADYILANSKYPRSVWVDVFPDIFTSTEFSIIPQWQLKSIPNETPRGEMYSPILTHSAIMTNVKKIVPYAAAHLNAHVQVMPISFKSLIAIVIGDIGNRNGQFKISDVMPDYTMIRTTSIDFNRMTADTIAVIMKLQNAVVAAEEMDEYSYIGLEYSKVERNGKWYVGFDHNRIQYLVLSRTSALQVL